jgi:hypothetical protein
MKCSAKPSVVLTDDHPLIRSALREVPRVMAKVSIWWKPRIPDEVSRR